MASLPRQGVYRFKHVESNSLLTLSSGKTVIGSVEGDGAKSQWRLSPAKDIHGGYHVTSVVDDQHLFYNGDTNRIGMSGMGIWCLQSTGKPNEYYFHMQWDHLVAVIEKAGATYTPKVRRAQLNITDKWILEFVGPLDKVLPAPTLYQNIHYPFAPGNYTIRNAATGTVMEVNASTGKVFGHRANGSKSQQLNLRPTSVGTCMSIMLLNGGMTGVSDVKQDEVVKASSLYNLNFMLILIRADKGFWIGHLSNPFLVYDLRGGNPADGTEICLWPKNDLDHQKWYFDPV